MLRTEVYLKGSPYCIQLDILKERELAKKILMAVCSFYPANNPRAVQSYELYRELKRRGYSIDICYTPKKKLIYGEEIKEYIHCQSGTIQKETFNAQEKKNILLTGFKKLVCYVIGEKGAFIYWNWIKSTVDITNYDCVISIAAPFYNHILLSRLIKKCKNKKIRTICDNGDPFYNPDKHSPIVKRMQIKAFQAFDVIIFPIESARSYYEKYAEKDKLFVIPQGRNFDDITLSDYKENETVTFAYAGAFFSDIRNPESFLNMLCSVDKDFTFIMYTELVGTVYEDILLPYKKKLGDKLQLETIIPRKQCIKELSCMDFLVNFENMSAMQQPSKLIDYALTKRPILSVRQDRINREEFMRFVQRDYKNRLQIDIEKYNMKHVCDEYINHIESGDC